jgi:hypothetical protein
MRNRVKLYTANIEMCRRAVEMADDKMLRARWNELAAQWTKLAEEAGKTRRRRRGSRVIPMTKPEPSPSPDRGPAARGYPAIR